MATLGVVTAVVPSGDDTSSVIDLRRHKIVGLRTPAALTQASLTFVASEFDPNAPDAPTFVEVRDQSANVVTVTVAAARYIVFDSDLADNLVGLLYGKIVMAGNEAADRTFKVITLSL